MGNFKKSNRKLGKFLKNTKVNHDRKELLKLGVGVVSGAVVFNILLSGTAFAHTNVLAVNVPHVNVTGLDQSPVPGTQCWKLVGVHASVPHANTPHSSAY